MVDLFIVKFKNVKALIELIGLLAISTDIADSLVRWAQENIKTPSDNVLLVDQTTRELKILTKKWYKAYYGQACRSGSGNSLWRMRRGFCKSFLFLFIKPS